MTDDPRAPDGGPPAHRPDDELVSAYLDDEVTADERALVEGNATRRARAEELGAVRDAVRWITPLADAAREEMLATVLRRLDQPVAPVVPVRRRGRFDATKGLAVAAAVVAIGLLGFALALADSEGSDDSDAASTREEAAVTMEADAAGGGESSDDAGGDAATESAPDEDTGAAGDGSSQVSDEEGLGEFTDTQELEVAARAAVGDRSADPRASGATTDSSACAPTVGVQLRASLDGRPVLVDVPDDLAADIIVRDEATCDRITSFPR